jgi:uncharacterized protein YqfB (UPF0267 family)
MAAVAEMLVVLFSTVVVLSISVLDLELLLLQEAEPKRVALISIKAESFFIDLIFDGLEKFWVVKIMNEKKMTAST